MVLSDEQRGSNIDIAAPGTIKTFECGGVSWG